jgi:hypothetical protein
LRADVTFVCVERQWGHDALTGSFGLSRSDAFSTFFGSSTAARKVFPQ